MTELFTLDAFWFFDSELVGNLRNSRWSYAALNATHIFGIGLLIGGIFPLDLRLLGVWPRIPVPELCRVLVPMAGFGLLLAILSGFLLFSVHPTDYITLRVFQFKLSVIVVGTLSAIVFHIRHGWWLATAPKGQKATAGIISMFCWVSALFAGRLIGFVQN